MTAGGAHAISTTLQHHHHKYKVLALFAALSFANAVLLMDYADDYTLVTHALRLGVTQVREREAVRRRRAAAAVREQRARDHHAERDEAHARHP